MTPAVLDEPGDGAGHGDRLGAGPRPGQQGVQDDLQQHGRHLPRLRLRGMGRRWKQLLLALQRYYTSDNLAIV